MSTKEFPDVLQAIYSMDNADICRVGEHLGYDWNQVCDEIGKAGCYAEDGDGAFTIHRHRDNDYYDNKILNEIFVAIFDHYKDVKKFQIVN